MARLKNVSGETKEVPLLANLGLPLVVEADEVVEVPDEAFAEFAWPESTWQVTKPAAKQAAKPADQEEEG
jgi:hypothetical protein